MQQREGTGVGVVNVKKGARKTYCEIWWNLWSAVDNNDVDKIQIKTLSENIFSSSASNLKLVVFLYQNENIF